MTDDVQNSEEHRNISFSQAIVQAALLLWQSVMLNCNAADTCILTHSAQSDLLYICSCSCYMPEMLMSNIMPPLTLSAGCKCYHRSLPRHYTPISIHLTHGSNIAARLAPRVRERCHVIYLITHPPPWKLLDLCGCCSQKNCPGFPVSSHSVLHQKSLIHVKYDTILIKRDTHRLLH